MDKRIKLLMCHTCGTTIERDLMNRNCSNCFACTGCEIYICPGCGTEIIVMPKKQTP